VDTPLCSCKVSVKFFLDIGIMVNLVIFLFFVLPPVNLAISATNIAGFDHS
jgi:hypothetical protein